MNASTFLDEFTNLLSDASLAKGQLLVVGDFNFQMDIPNHPDSENFLNLLDTFSLKQHVRSPTHRLGHTLDLILTRSTGSIVDNVSVNEPQISDHHVIHFDIRTSKPPLPMKTINCQSYKKLDLLSFKRDIELSELS